MICGRTQEIAKVFLTVALSAIIVVSAFTGQFLLMQMGSHESSKLVHHVYASLLTHNGDVRYESTPVLGATSLESLTTGYVGSQYTKFAIAMIPGKITVLGESANPNELSGTYEYVIVTPSAYTRLFHRLALIRAVEGMNVLIVPLETIIMNFNGISNADRLRSFAQFAKSNLGAKYLLLGGDVNLVPTAYWYAEEVISWANENELKATDMYYVYLDGNWDPNGNGKLLETIDTNGDGEPDQDIEPLPDLIPDLYVGRLPGEDGNELSFLIEAVINYEVNPPAGDWVKRAYLFAGIANYANQSGNDWPKTDLATLAEYLINDILGPSSYNYVRYYQDYGLNPTSYYHEKSLTEQEVYDALMSGAGLILSSGHGNTTVQGTIVWVTDDGDNIPEDNELEYRVFLRKFPNIHSEEGLAVMYISACLSGYLDAPEESLAEYLLGRVAVAVIASSRSSYYQIGWDGPGNYLEQELAYLFFKDLVVTGFRRVGVALAMSKLDYVNEHGGTYSNYQEKKDLLNYNLLGDPATRLWTEPPGRFYLNYTNLKSGALTTFKAIDAAEGTPVEGVTIALYNATSLGLISYSITGADGEATLKIPVISKDANVYIVAYKDGYAKVLGQETISAKGSPPYISIESPRDSFTYGPEIPINITITDSDGIIKQVNVTLLKNMPVWQIITSPNTDSYSLSTSINVSEGGTYRMIIEAIDDDGNVVNTTVVFYVDLTPPMIIIQSPINNTVSAALWLPVSFTVSDDTQVTRYTVVLDGKMIDDSVVGSRNMTAQVDVGPLTEGPHAILVAAQDSAGNSATVVLLIYIDREPPTITYYPNIDGLVINTTATKSVVFVTNDNYGVAYVTVYLDDQVVFNGSQGELAQLNLTGLSEGHHVVKASAVDKAGNYAEVMITFTIDNEPPSIKLETIPNREYINTTSFNASITMSDNIGLSKIEVVLDGNEVLLKYLPSNTRTFEKELSFANLSIGPHELRVCSLDSAGNEACVSRSITVDFVPPKIVFVNVTNTTIVGRSKIAVPFVVKDSSGISMVKALVNGTVVYMGANATNNTVLLSGLNSGKYLISVWAEDSAGNQAKLSVLLRVDIDPPIVNILTPTNNSSVPEKFQLVFKVTDNMGIKEINVSVDGNIVKSFEIGELRSVTERTELKDLIEGTHKITITAEDVGGNVFTLSITVFVDKTPPQVTLLNETVVSTASPVLVFKSSEDLAYLDVIVNDRVYRAYRLGDYWYVKLTDLKEGNNDLLIQAKDLAGNIAEKRITLHLIRSFRPEVLLLVMLSVVIIVVAVYLFLRYRRHF